MFAVVLMAACFFSYIILLYKETINTASSVFDVFSEKSQSEADIMEDSCSHSSFSKSSSNSIDSSYETNLFIPQNFPSSVAIDEGEAVLIFTGLNMWTQGMCVSNNTIFITQCSSSQGQYHISRVSHSGSIYSSSCNTFNHANGMSYDEDQNKLYVCKFAANSSTDGCDRDCDFSLLLINADTFEIEQEIDLFDVVKGVCAESIGIGGVAYNNKSKQLCVFTRKPKRYIIFLDDNYAYESSLYICDDYGEVLFGDICWFDEYLVTCYWDWGYSNLVSFYDCYGNMIKSIELTGITHIESIDFYENKLFASFNDFSNDIDTKVFAIEAHQ